MNDSPNQMLSDSLPRFGNPPVVETVVGVQFDRLPRFGNAHLGAFWRSLGADWPSVSDAPPLEQQFEEFGEGKTWKIAGLQLKVLPELTLRLQIRNRTNDRMIQLQNGRLHYNWLGHGGDAYPQYENVKPEFDHALEMFEQFVAEEVLGEFRPNQWEITYVNHIPKGTVWNSPADWTGLFPSLSVPPPVAAPLRLESFGGEWHYEIAPELGRLHVNLTHGWRKDAAEEVLVLNLTARGRVPLNDTGGPNLEEGLRTGHETIVRAFRDLTSARAHKYWRLIDDET